MTQSTHWTNRFRRQAASLTKHPGLFLWLTVALGVLLLWPSTHFINLISQGDHGRDYYCYAATLRGSVPYQDYWWVYGPLMPYYYALCFKILGLTIPSILIGETLLKLLAGIFIFRTIRLVAGGGWALVSALWFWAFYPFFFFTHNHSGGIMLMLAAAYYLIHYIHQERPASLYKALLAVALAALVKFNTGIALWAALLFSVFLTKITSKDSPRVPRTFWAAGLGLPVLVGAVYAGFLHGLSLPLIKQYFPYLPNNQQIHWPLLFNWLALQDYYLRLAVRSWGHILLTALILITIIRVGRDLHKAPEGSPEKRRTLLTGLGLFLFTLSQAHEYLLSGVPYRLYWVTPFYILGFFFLLGTATRRDSRLSQVIVPVLFLVIIACSRPTPQWQQANDPVRFWADPRAQVYCQNTTNWLQVVQETTDYLRKNLAPQETFWAIPYDPLYYYLTDRLAPHRQLMLFQNNNLTPSDENEIIQTLENQAVNIVVASNRIYSDEDNLGIFGESHCRNLAAYLRENFQPVLSLGDWATPTGRWGNNHATMILRRVQPLSATPGR